MTAARAVTPSPFRLGMIATLSTFLAADLLSMLMCASTDLTISLTEARTDTLLTALRTGELDAAILATPLDGEDLLERDLFDEPLLLGQAAGMRTDRIEPGSLLLPADGDGMRDLALAACGEAAAARWVRSDNLITLIGLAASGLGVAVVPALAAPWAQSLVLRPFEGARRRIRLAARRGSGNDHILTRITAAARSIAALPAMWDAPSAPT
jgi:LysR family transcriptional regulator, hydrogen peroxide-inducible genes activator